MSESESLADRVFVALRDDLMWGRFRPTDRLAENSLAERYEVSRTPVREALARLLADGLIERRDPALFGIGRDSYLVAATYLGGITLLFTLR